MSAGSILLDYTVLERLARTPEMKNVIIGTGAPARDLRDKLLLLGLPVPFLVGDREDSEQGIRHYSAISKLEDPQSWRFILCCDLDEWTLIAPAQMEAFRLLGHASWNHPQVVRFCADTILYEQAGEYVTDAMNGNVVLREGKPYRIYGEEKEGVFRIHLLGLCQTGGVLQFTRESAPEQLQQLLDEAGFPCVVYAWSQPLNPIGNSISSLVRDLSPHQIDLLILYTGLVEQDPLRITTKNVLSTRVGTATSLQPFLLRAAAVHSGEISSGINHEIGLAALRAVQQRIFIALSRFHGYAFWDVVAPLTTILPQEQAKKLRGLSPGYLARQKRKIEEALAALDPRYTRDYTGLFAGVEDVRDMYTDSTHLSDQGNRLVAERFATEILQEFGGGRGVPQ